MSALPRISGADLAEIARLLTIQDHETGTRTRWVPNVEQTRMWAECSAHRFVYVLKPRQVGASTAACLDDAVWTATCDAAGHRVRCAIVVDTFDKAMERLWVCEDFLRQLGLPHRRADNVIRFPNGSEIVAWSAGSDEVGRSLSIQRLHITELPFWEKPKDAYIALMQGLSLDGECLIETTADIKTPFARDLWREDNEFRKVFFPVTMHDEYRADPTSITDEQFAEVLDNIGAVERDVAAWLVWAVANKCGGDWLKARREYPPTEGDCWAASEGRWVSVTSRVLQPVEVLRVMGVGGDVWPLSIWRKPEQSTGPFRIACDSAKGSGVSRSTVCVVDTADGKLVASFADSTIMGDDHALVAQRAWSHYSRRLEGTDNYERPHLGAEDNTTGQIFIQPARRLGLPVHTFDTTEASQMLGMQEARRAIQLGLLEGPKELAEECDECTRDPVTGKWKGHKDLMMTYGMCMRNVVKKPIGPVPDTRVEHKIDGARIIKNLMRQERMRGWR